MSEAHEWWLWHGLECCKVCGIIRRRDDKNTPCKGPTRVGPRGQPAFGWNDASGVAHCGFCEWSKACGPNMERIEHELRKHVEECHGRSIIMGTDNLTGDVTVIP